MGTLQQAIEAIKSAEERLRGLIAEAAENAEYDQVPQLADWAKQLCTIVSGQRALPAARAVVDGVVGEEVIHHSPGSESQISLTEVVKPTHDLHRSAPRPAQTKRKGGRTRKKSRRARTRRGEYPKFLREGQFLVKVGWSKKGKEPYEHKAPWRVVTLLAESLTNTGRGGRRFSVEDLLPLNALGEGGEVPSYQAYLALAWLRTEGLVTQHGRQGYSLPEASDLSALIDERWESLPSR